MNEPRYILCAAIWYQTDKKCPLQPDNIKKGYVIAGRRHSNVIGTALALGVITATTNHVQGFLTNDNLFLDRREAAYIAFEAGQIDSEVTELNSNHLY